MYERRWGTAGHGSSRVLLCYGELETSASELHILAAFGHTVDSYDHGHAFVIRITVQLRLDCARANRLPNLAAGIELDRPKESPRSDAAITIAIEHGGVRILSQVL